MTTRGGYALDLLSPVRHVATEMERAGSDGPAPTIAEMAATYEHTIAGDLARIRQNEGASSDYEARLWLIRRAVSELGRQVTPDGGGYRLARPFGELKYQGRIVRRAVRAGEESEKEILRAVYHNLDKELRPFRVTVASARGASREMALTLHPLAHAIPRMTEKEFADLATDMKEHGFRKQFPPIFTMKGKVIDGRHRLAIGSALKIPVRVEEFTGTEDEARGHIVSANLVRRHLTMAQRGLIVRQIFLPEAEAEARERQRSALKNGPPSSAPIGANEKAAEIAAKKSSGLATTRTIERMAPVDHAPQTQERIRSGEIKSSAEARREALKETGSDEAADLPALEPRSAYRRLGCALGDVRSALTSIEDGDRGDVTEETFLERIGEIRQALHDLRKLVRP